MRVLEATLGREAIGEEGKPDHDAPRTNRKLFSLIVAAHDSRTGYAPQVLLLPLEEL